MMNAIYLILWMSFKIYCETTLWKNGSAGKLSTCFTQHSKILHLIRLRMQALLAFAITAIGRFVFITSSRFCCLFAVSFCIWSLIKKMFLMNLWAQRNSLGRDSCQARFCRLCTKDKCWKEVLVLPDLVWVFCIDIQIVINQERHLILSSYSLWILYLNVIFTFVSCVSCSCLSGFQKEKKKIYYTLQSLRVLKLFQTKIGIAGEVCSIGSFCCLLLSITHSFSEDKSFTRKVKVKFKVNCWTCALFSVLLLLFFFFLSVSKMNLQFFLEIVSTNTENMVKRKQQYPSPPFNWVFGIGWGIKFLKQEDQSFFQVPMGSISAMMASAGPYESPQSAVLLNSYN